MAHAFDVLGEPVRRRILELLADGEQTSGALCAVIQHEFGITQPGVSAHLRVLRDSGFATARAQGARVQLRHSAAYTSKTFTSRAFVSMKIRRGST